MKSDSLYIVGAGGFGKEVRSMLIATNHSFSGFLDDDPAKGMVSKSIDWYLENHKTKTSDLVIAVGSSKTRKLLLERLSNHSSFPAIVHPTVIFQDINSCKYGAGAIICAGSVLTCDVNIGRFALINLNCTIGHDVKMGDFCSLMPSVNLSGNVTLEDGVFIGTGATILQGITIGKDAVIGAGALVTKDVAANTTVIGIPARPR